MNKDIKMCGGKDCEKEADYGVLLLVNGSYVRYMQCSDCLLNNINENGLKLMDQMSICNLRRDNIIISDNKKST
jgi:hypothetical protein